MTEKAKKWRVALFTLSLALIVLGFLFLVNAMGAARLFPAFYDIHNVLAKYIVVILTMAAGIMLFSNVAARVPEKKKRNALTIGITAFSTLMTLPLVYVFVAIFPARIHGAIGPVGQIMALGDIVQGFVEWFGSGAFLYVVFAFMLLLSLVFLAFPLLTGILTVQGKTIKVGKDAAGKFGIRIEPLPF